VSKSGTTRKSAADFDRASQFADTEKDKAFIESIVSGNFHNQVAKGVESALSAQLGRTVAFAGRPGTWDELIASIQTYDAAMQGIDLTEFA
jgi:myo-inositol 2-dehydrogenase / D-chiro-inositol 1-dehydrogenase